MSRLVTLVTVDVAPIAEGSTNSPRSKRDTRLSVTDRTNPTGRVVFARAVADGTAQVKQARSLAQAAEQAADDLRSAIEARRTARMWVRLWQAWRRE